MGKTLGWFAHAAVLGVLLALLLARSAQQHGVAWWLLAIHAVLLSASPLLALALSLPLPRRKRAQGGLVIENVR